MKQSKSNPPLEKRIQREGALAQRAARKAPERPSWRRLRGLTRAPRSVARLIMVRYMHFYKDYRRRLKRLFQDNVTSTLLTHICSMRLLSPIGKPFYLDFGFLIIWLRRHQYPFESSQTIYKNSLLTEKSFCCVGQHMTCDSVRPSLISCISALWNMSRTAVSRIMLTNVLDT